MNNDIKYTLEKRYRYVTDRYEVNYLYSLLDNINFKSKRPKSTILEAIIKFKRLLRL